jgi:uncharacterized membrane-anchored protein YjiN (DUF445 family)
MDETIPQIDPHKAIAYIMENATPYSIAKGSRIESEHLLKTVKAILMNEESGSVASKEAYALSHDTYIEKIEEIKKYTVEEEYLKMMIDAAKARIEVWKVQEYSKRAEIKAGL